MKDESNFSSSLHQQISQLNNLYYSSQLWCFSMLNESMVEKQVTHLLIIILITRTNMIKASVYSSNDDVPRHFNNSREDFSTSFNVMICQILIKILSDTIIEYYSIPWLLSKCFGLYVNTSPSERFIGSSFNRIYSKEIFSLDHDQNIYFYYVSKFKCEQGAD